MRDNDLHKKVMYDLLQFINKESKDFILKGGTALMFCYNLNRFSEDLDFDTGSRKMLTLLEKFSNVYNYKLGIAKNTTTGQRLKLHYDEKNPDVFLKIDVSFRTGHVDDSLVTTINNIRVYKIGPLASLKAAAYIGRDKIRDLYDVCFITNNYFNMLDSNAKMSLANALALKGISQVDYLIATQKDDLVDSGKLVSDYLDACSKLNIPLDDSDGDDF